MSLEIHYIKCNVIDQRLRHVTLGITFKNSEVNSLIRCVRSSLVSASGLVGRGEIKGCVCGAFEEAVEDDPLLHRDC